MKKIVLLVTALVLVLTSVAFAERYGDYEGKLYATTESGNCSALGKTIDFYVDGIFVSRVSPGSYGLAYVSPGQHKLEVYYPGGSERLKDPYYFTPSGSGWWYWYGCHPK